MSAHARDPLLSRRSYDRDATIIESESDRESGSDADESDVLSPPNDDDQLILNEPKEEEELLAKPGRFDTIKNVMIGKEHRSSRTKRLSNGRSKRIKQDVAGSGDAGMIYEMESGYKDNSSRSSTESLALADEKWNRESSIKKPFAKLMGIAVGILLLFILLAYGSYRASQHKNVALTISNGTHIFGPTTILISLDGFRADFLNRGLTPAMKAFIESGVSPKYMLPSFPSLTFPNHFTLVTGLHPESHGIVSNQFWDPEMREEFYYTNTSSSMQPKWWNAEPLWVTAEKAGLKTAIHMWPGSEAHIDSRDPTYLDKYNGSESLDVKVQQILHWLDMPQNERPQFIGAYVPNVDADGHKYGPNSTEIRATIAEVDLMLTNLIEGLLKRNLTEIVNMVIVSDHGMATTSNDRLIQLDDFIDMSLVDHIDGWPLRGLRLENPDRDLQLFHNQLLEASKDHQFDVYTRETMPARYHFSNNDRIAPLWVVPRAGWAVVEKDDFDIVEAQATGKQYAPLGLHGYDHEHPLMRAIFIARGPAFKHEPNSRVAAFQNIEVYNIVCDSLGIKPHPNNGTLRLPLVVEGLHGDSEQIDTPADPVTISVAPKPTQASKTIIPTMTSEPTTSESIPTTSEQSDAKDQPEDMSKKHTSWWDFLHNKLDKAKEWAKELVDSIRNNNSSGEQPT